MKDPRETHPLLTVSLYAVCAVLLLLGAAL